jgi:hypothetical protein
VESDSRGVGEPLQPPPPSPLSGSAKRRRRRGERRTGSPRRHDTLLVLLVDNSSWCYLARGYSRSSATGLKAPLGVGLASPCPLVAQESRGSSGGLGRARARLPKKPPARGVSSSDSDSDSGNGNGISTNGNVGIDGSSYGGGALPSRRPCRGRRARGASPLAYVTRRLAHTCGSVCVRVCMCVVGRLCSGAATT